MERILCTGGGDFIGSRLARAKLGWEPKISLASGLKPTVAFFRNHDEADVTAGESKAAHLALLRAPQR